MPSGGRGGSPQAASSSSATIVDRRTPRPARAPGPHIGRDVYHRSRPERKQKLRTLLNGVGGTGEMPAQRRNVGDDRPARGDERGPQRRVELLSRGEPLQAMGVLGQRLL